MIYIHLFLVFLKIGLFSFGGGYAVLSLIQQEVIEKYQWVSLSEFTEIVAVSQVTPGPIGINSATFIGYKVTGNAFGSLCSTTGVVLPSIIILVLISLFLQKFKDSLTVKRIFLSLRPVVLGLVLGAGVSLLHPENFGHPVTYVVFAMVVLAGIFTKINPILLILLSGTVGFFVL
ncbi:chromate transport protein [Fusobacterium equinum]|uniref:Chromate transport protein n=1 Tax=Fusobacterium equinum TaxID=134605 RepID=A0A133NJU6_9FUSO|nr:chromate transporter [Fusobacterium equinum]KXA16566.1 chromate transport protein [Fusobacterium equinum]